MLCCSDRQLPISSWLACRPEICVQSQSAPPTRRARTCDGACTSPSWSSRALGSCPMPCDVLILDSSHRMHQPPMTRRTCRAADRLYLVGLSTTLDANRRSSTPLNSLLDGVAHTSHLALDLDPLDLDPAKLLGVAHVRAATWAPQAANANDSHPSGPPKVAIRGKGVRGADSVQLLRIDCLQDRRHCLRDKLVHRRLQTRNQGVALGGIELAIIFDVGARREVVAFGGL
mmetsp:Transcript_44810/g.117548  ORF Transcript_44810/g.117548 Transcript_44810/m.117548 type:complete len:230 (-) Transcript_44810:706-1395(-)